MSLFYSSMAFRLEDAAIRPGSSPSDLKIIMVPNVILVDSAATIDLTPFIPANTVVLSYWVSKQATTSSKVLTIGAAVAGATDTVDIFIVGLQTKFQ